LKEEVKTRLFLAAIPLAENTAAVEMRKRLMGFTGHQVHTAVLQFPVLWVVSKLPGVRLLSWYWG